MKKSLTIGVIVSIAIAIFVIRQTQFFKRGESSREEILHIDVSEHTSLVSTRTYMGMIEVTISGSIFDTERGEYVDGYYVHSENNELIQVSSETLLRINNNSTLPPYGGGTPPTYDKNHTYTFAYFLGVQEEQIQFDVSCPESSNCTGILTVEIRAAPEYIGR